MGDGVIGESKSCTECGHTVSEQARFCERCGAVLRSGAEPLRAPDALAGKILSERSEIEGERKQVTVMFADIVRSMELTQSLETERWGVVLDRFLAIACGVIHELEGTVNQFTGDGLMAVFGAPLSHEDHPRRACLTALELQRRIAPFAEELAQSDGVEFSIRCGLNSGEVIVGSIGDDLHMDFAPIGNTTGLGKRIESLAPEASTALSASTASLIEGEFELRELGEFEVKGMSEPQRVFELLGPGRAHTRLEAAEARGLSRFVGRVDERARLEAALEHALAGVGQIVGVRGEPGIGKSRLVHELARDCRDRGLRINTGRAVAHGRAVPLLPVLGMLRDFFGVRERDGPETARERIENTLLELDPSFEPELPLVFDFLGVSDPERPLERIDPEARQRRVLAFVGRLVEARSRHEPAVIVIEDLHWIDEASAAFLDALVHAVAGTRTLLVVTFRPEYEPAWTPPYDHLALAPLDAEASGELLEGLLGTDASLDGLAELIHGRTRGNPFFIEELVQALDETGHLAGERGAYRLAGTLEELALPPTVQAVLAARIDRLGAREKALVQTMSVIGKDVPEPVLREVSELKGAALRDSVGALEAAEFLAEARSNGHREFTFKHPLTQEVAYASQLSEPRARAHTAVAEAIERLYPDGLDERAALLAHHSEAAGKKLEAAQWHARAAAWISVSSPAEGMRHWRRVRELTDELESSREVEQLAVLARISILALAWRLGMSHGETAAIHAEGEERLAAGDTEKSRQPVRSRGAPEKERAGDRGRERVLLDVAYAMNLLLGGHERQGLEILRAARRRAAETGEPGLVLTTSGLAGFAACVIGLPREGLELADDALALAGDDVLAGSGLILGNPYAHCLWVRGYSEGCLGDLDQAWRDIERSIEVARKHRDPECEGYALIARIFLSTEIPGLAPALRDAERALEIAAGAGNMNQLGAAHAGMAMVCAEREEFAEARAAANEALAITRERRANLEWEPDILSALARARLGLGGVPEARVTAEEAVAIAERRSLDRGALPAQLTLARVLMATEGADQSDAIESALSRALELARESESLAHEPAVHNQLAALARLRGDEAEAKREEAEAERILAEMGVRRERVEALREGPD